MHPLAHEDKVKPNALDEACTGHGEPMALTALYFHLSQARDFNSATARNLESCLLILLGYCMRPARPWPSFCPVFKNASAVFPAQTSPGPGAGASITSGANTATSRYLVAAGSSSPSGLPQRVAVGVHICVVHRVELHLGESDVVLPQKASLAICGHGGDRILDLRFLVHVHHLSSLLEPGISAGSKRVYSHWRSFSGQEQPRCQ